MCAYLLHGADEILSGLADVAADGGGSSPLVGRLRAILAAHLHGVAGFGRPAQLVVNDKVDRKHIEALKKKKANKSRINLLLKLTCFLFVFLDIFAC